MDLDPQQIQQMIQLLQAMLPKEDNTHQENEKSVPQPPVSPKPSRPPSRSFRDKTPTEHHNLFDSMMESRLHKDDCKIDKLLSVVEPTPRLRSFEPIDVRCRVCGKKDSINPVLLTDAPDRYKCNKCARTPG